MALLLDVSLEPLKLPNAPDLVPVLLDELPLVDEERGLDFAPPSSLLPPLKREVNPPRVAPIPDFSPSVVFGDLGLLSPLLPPMGKLEETRLNKPVFSPSLGGDFFAVSPPPLTRERILLKPAPKREVTELPTLSSFLVSPDLDEDADEDGDEVDPLVRDGGLDVALLDRNPPVPELELDGLLLDDPDDPAELDPDE